MSSYFNQNLELNYCEKKHFNELLSNLKPLSIFDNSTFTSKKFYFGGIFSAPQNDLCPNGALYANGFSYFGINKSYGVAHLTNGSAVLSLNKTYLNSKSFFNRNRQSESDTWTFVKSNFFFKPRTIFNQQLNNFAIKSYRSSLINHLSFPASRYDRILGTRLGESCAEYDIYVPSNAFSYLGDNFFTAENIFLVPSVSFFKLQSYFLTLEKTNIFLTTVPRVLPTDVRTNFYNLSDRMESFCAKTVTAEHFKSFNSISAAFNKKHFFLKSFDFKNYLASVRKILPTNKPSVLSRFFLTSYVVRNASLKIDKRYSGLVSRYWLKSHYEILYNDYLKLSAAGAKLILTTSHFSNIFSKNFSKINNPLSKIIFRHLHNRTLSSLSLFFHSSNLSNIHNFHLFENFFVKDLEYKRSRYFSYRRSRLSKYYKVWWSLPDTKTLKTRRR